ncbi:restriction endonuclease subunit S [Brucella intermedia]|uniref:restriction endonuclease subunit S n=1 Tax=Brucella intermedia TaxID=94625 RepID=UPI0025579661|nr:restriction endonuclease subunit S [Brucella intermedia]MDL2201368.1 restriction endonuclease subunit S [Brucella intermedia]
MSLNLPKGWERLELGLFCTEHRRRAKSGDLPIFSVSKDHGLIAQAELFDRRIASADTSNYKTLKRGEYAYDPMLLWTGSIGCLWRSIEAMISPAYTTFGINDKVVVPKFFDTLIKMPRMIERYRSISHGTNVRRKKAHFDDFSALVVAVPPLPEQRAIADVLSAVEEAIDKTEALIAALVESRVELTRAFQGSEEQPKWPLRSIGSLVRQCQYGLSIPLDGEGKVPVLRMPDIGDGRVNIDVGALKSTDVTPAEIASCAIREGDILFNRTNSQALVGKTGIVRGAPSEHVVFASYLIRLVAKTGVNPFWLNGVLNLPRTQERLKTLATPGVSQWNINSKTLKRFEIAVPPKADQDQFADLYEAIEARLDAERAKLNTTLKVRAALAQELLSGRVRLPESIVARHREKAGQAA